MFDWKYNVGGFKKNRISEILKKKKDQIFIEIVENNIDLFSLIIINKAFEIAASKRFDFIINSLIENRMLNSDNAIQISIAQNNAALLKSLLQKINECINMNKFIEFVLSSNQNIQNIYYSYAQISDYTKKLLKNENDFVFDASNVNNLLQLAK